MATDEKDAKKALPSLALLLLLGGGGYALYRYLREVTETLTPNAPGDVTFLTPVGTTENWQCVDDVEPNEDIDYVYKTWGSDIDLYNIPDPSISGVIKSVTVYVRGKGLGVEEIYEQYPASSRSMIKIGDLESYGLEFKYANGAPYTTHSFTWTKNPATGSAWTRDEINALQIGVSLYAPRDCYSYCTQVYAKVKYTKYPTV